MAKTTHWLIGLATLVVTHQGVAQVPSDHKPALEVAQMYHEAISHATDLYEAASMAARCGFMDWPQSFQLQQKIQIGEVKNIDNYANFTDDKERFRAIARDLLGEQTQRMGTFQAIIGHTGVSTGLCLDLKHSGVVDTLNSLSK